MDILAMAAVAVAFVFLILWLVERGKTRNAQIMVSYSNAYREKSKAEADEYSEITRAEANEYSAGRRAEADKYSAGKHAEADEYSVGKHAEADEYSAGKHAEADEYLENKTAEANALYEDKKREALDYYWKKTENGNKKAQELDRKIAELDAERSELQKEVDELGREAVCAAVSIEAYEGLKSDEIKNKLVLLKTRQDELIRSDAALVVTNESAQRRVVDSQKKQILRCFNAESSSIIGSVTAKNVDISRSKLQKSFDALNKIFAVDGVQLSHEVFALKLEELSLVYAYMVHEEEEREQRKAIREQMVEEDKVRREIEREKQKIEKEQTQFNNEVNKLMQYMQKSKDDAERNLYIEKINELEAKLKALEADKENVLQREQNTRAGFVYIISNIGSFGERVFKIGMTRRLEPMDRIAELSSASVPFPFDVHALIFSDDAPGLEAILHRHFDSNRVNRVNPRKEFFRVDLDEIKSVVIKNHNATVKFVDIPDALEYRETLKMNSEET